MHGAPDGDGLALNVKLRPCAPICGVHIEGVDPGVAFAGPHALVVGPVLAHVDAKLQGSDLTGVKFVFGRCEVRLEGGRPVGNEHVVRVVGGVDAKQPSRAVVEVVPIALPLVPDAVRVDRNRALAQHHVADFCRVPDRELREVHETVEVGVAQLLQRACQPHGGVDVHQTVTQAPIVALPGR